MKKRSVGTLVLVSVLVLLLVLPFFLSLTARESRSVTLRPVSGSGKTLDDFPAYPSAEAFIGEMTPVAENSGFALYYHEELAAIALYDKVHDQWLTSNPFGLSDCGAERAAVNELASQVILTYYDDAGRAGQLNSFSDCVQKGQFSATVGENELTVDMLLGESASSTLYPEQLSAEKLDSLLPSVDEDGRELIERVYEKYTLDGLNEETQAALLKQYPYLKTGDVYVAGAMSKRDRKRLSALFEDIGFSEEQKLAEYEKLGFAADENKPAFSLTLRYTLTESGLSVSLPLDSVTYNSRYFRADTVTLLPYFGCGARTDSNGLLLIPDGSGAVMTYNTAGQKRLSALSLAVYGTDAAAVSDYTAHTTGQPVILPAFGNRHSAGAYLAMAEEGESLCRITADAGDAGMPYATAYVTASCRYSEEYFYNDKDFSKNVRAFAGEPNKGTVTVSYFPLAKDSGYAEMAQACKARLIDCGVLTERGVMPHLTLELLGMAGEGSERFALTTFADAAAVADELRKAGVDALALRYTGVYAGGLSNTFTKTLRLPSLLGGADGYAVLQKQLSANGVPLYMDAELAYVRRTGWFDGYSVDRDTCRTLRNQLTGLYAYNEGESGVDKSTLAYAVSPLRLRDAAAGVHSAFAAQCQGARLSVGSLGSALHSTFKSGETITRDEAQAAVEESLKALAGSQKLMVSQGNAYTWRYADFILDLPVTSGGYAAIDYEVPFVQLVLNGCVEYAAASINESEDSRGQLLKALETGSGLHYVAACRSRTRLKSSAQSAYYSVDYDTLKGDMLTLYAAYREAFAAIGSTKIISHRRLAEGVYETTYATGAAVTVNYGETDYTAAGVTVPAGGYRIEKGGVPDETTAAFP